MIREQWLNKAIDDIHVSLFAPLGESKPDNLKVSCGFPAGRGSSLKAIGQCWDVKASATDSIEMFISPVLDDAVRVLDVLCHEMVHAYRPGAGHGPKFRKLALAIGLAGKMTATIAGPELEETLKGISAKLGKYPHGALNIGEGRKKQTTRMIKMTCHSCGFIARASRGAVENSGVPSCGCGAGELDTV